MYKTPQPCNYYGCKYQVGGYCYNGFAIYGDPDTELFDRDNCPRENDKEELMYYGRK